MTSGPQTNGTPASHPGIRLRLKPTAPATGYVDGAWWPRSHDLGTELVTLANVLEARLGRVERVAYALSMWDAAPRRIGTGDDAIRLEGFSHQDRNILHVIGANRGRVTLLVVPPELANAPGHDAMVKAARGGNADRPEEILAAAVVPAPRKDQNPTKQGGTTR